MDGTCHHEHPMKTQTEVWLKQVPTSSLSRVNSAKIISLQGNMLQLEGAEVRGGLYAHGSLRKPEEGTG